MVTLIEHSSQLLRPVTLSHRLRVPRKFKFFNIFAMVREQFFLIFSFTSLSSSTSLTKASVTSYFYAYGIPNKVVQNLVSQSISKLCHLQDCNRASSFSPKLLLPERRSNSAKTSSVTPCCSTKSFTWYGVPGGLLGHGDQVCDAERGQCERKASSTGRWLTFLRPVPAIID